MHLFVIYIGGAHQHSLIELHDMRFVVANTIEETYPALRKSWWGTPESLHLDAWGVLDYADDYDISISDQPNLGVTENLFFINLGGYDKNQFTELHKNIFVVAKNEAEAKQKAVQQIQDWQSPHRDYLHQVENIINMNALLENNAHCYLQLKKTTETKSFEFTCLYTPIGK